MSAFAKFYFRPAKGERIHTTVTLHEEPGCAIFGTVTDGEKPVSGALVLLFETEGADTEALYSAATTGEDGSFAFGPLEAGRLYLARVYRDGVKLRELEIDV